jgi:hypothetical protein
VVNLLAKVAGNLNRDKHMCIARACSDGEIVGSEL